MHKGKSIIIHDFFLYRGWAERFDILAAKAMDADIAASFFSEKSFDVRSMGFNWKIIPYAPFLEKYFKGIRYILFKFSLLFKTRFLKDYDTVIFSGDTLSSVYNARKDSQKICYFHSIPRYLFDQKEYYYSKVPLWAKPAYLLIRTIFLRMFLFELSRMDKIFVNSTNLRNYLKEHVGYDSEILYPPADTRTFVPLDDWVKHTLHPALDWAWGLASGENVEYFVSFAKLSTLKRVKEAVEAFRSLPEQKLLVIYGENDPQLQEVFSAAEGIKNIFCTTLKNNNDLPAIVARAVATIFIPKNEDFGMVSLESQATWVPVIGVAEGGLLETVIDGKTGVLIQWDPTPKAILEAIEKLASLDEKDVYNSCIQNASRFWIETFEANILKNFS